ncbi:MAG TPA: NAD(P)/FAD-dependent oxidoreductase [Caldilineaceae bacterium]|nr:NAD(P)/FAD-dependent oxidoreductase [Caldilineaceae bacterium]
MSIPQTCDVVVIGGGPAGSVAATSLAQKGWRVVLLEKQRHPRYTVGESLIPDFWKYLEEIGAADKIRAEGFIAKGGGMVNWQGQPKAHTFKDFGYTQPAMHVERDRFDEILLRHAESEGVQVFEEYNVLKVDLPTEETPQTPARVYYRALNTQTEGTVTCQYVVDASGQNAVIGRQLGVRKFDDAFRFMSVWGYFTGAKYLDINGVAHAHSEVQETPPVTYVTSLDGIGNAGWCWYIALRESTSVGIVFPNESMKTLKPADESWETYYLRQVQATPVVGELLADATFCPDSIRVTRDYSYQSTQLAGPSYYLIGDAAGFVDPIFSVGIVLGIYSAHLAAWSIDSALSNPNVATSRPKLFEKQLRGRLEIARSLALPRYRTSGQVSEEAKGAIALESTNVKKMMKTVSSLTNRSDNFNTMTNGGEGIELNEYQLRIVEKLEVA